MTEKRRFEVGDVTIEVAGEHAAREVKAYRVGDPVKVLVKEYGSTYKTHPGVIVGFDAFEKLPTIVVAYVEDEFSSKGEVKFLYLNAQSKDVEVCPMVHEEERPSLEAMRQHFDRAIVTKMQELEELERRRNYYLEKFAQSFGLELPAEEPVE